MENNEQLPWFMVEWYVRSKTGKRFFQCVVKAHTALLALEECDCINWAYQPLATRLVADNTVLHTREE